MFNNKPTFNPDRRNDSVLGYAGRTISGQGKRPDRNFYTSPPSNDNNKHTFDIDNFLRNNPNAYDRYHQNLEKMNESKKKMDEYAREMNGKNADLFSKHRDVEGAKKLNEMNAQKHNEYLKDQMNNIRNFKSIRRNFSNDLTKPNHYGPGSNYHANYDDYRGDEDSMKLLDEYSNQNNLHDPFSGVARGISRENGMKRNASMNINQSKFIDEDPRIQDSFVDNRQVNKNQFNQFDQNPQANNMYPNQMYPPPFNPYQMNQMMSPYGGYPMGGMNPFQVYYPPYLMPQPFGMFPPMQPEEKKKESDIISAHIEKQAHILEALSKRLDGSPKERRRRSRSSSRDYERRLREMERENELKIQLMKQKQIIEDLVSRNNGQGGVGGGNMYDPQNLIGGLYGNNPLAGLPGMGMGNMNQLNNNLSYNPNMYQQQLQQLQQLTIQQQQQLQELQQQQQQLLLDQQYDYVPDYGGLYVPNKPQETEDDKKKKKKKKKKASSDEDSDESDDSHKKKKKKSKKKDDDSRSVASKATSNSRSKRTSKDSDSDTRSSMRSTIQGFESPKKKKRVTIRRLKVHLWTMVYPMMLAKDVKDRVDNRKNQQMSALDNTASPFLQSMSFYMMNACQNGFVEIFKDAKKTYDFIGVNKKKVTDRQKDERINLVLGRITKLCDLLFNAADAELDKSALEFLAQICLGEKYCPDYVLTTFELKRLDFNSYGRLLSMTKEHTRMVLICSAVIRILIFRMILRAKDWNQKIKFTETLELNLLILASVFYMIVGKMLAEQNPVINPNMRDVAPKPAQPLLARADTPAADPYKTDEMISGLYQWDDVNVVFLADYQPWIDTITNLLERWSDKMHQRILEHRRDNPLPPGDDPI